ncbi:MAG: MASE1 domain-containing protein [Lysobacter sp.]|nr:MASE1 domain-containing protein [Lysobacter sp.]
MEDAKWKSIAKGLAFSVVYCFAYLAAWFSSLDQWFLPAGLRIAGLLLLPIRYWPYLFVGDIAALLLLRVPRAGFDGELWAYASPFLLISAIALLPGLLHKRLSSLVGLVRWLPLVAVGLAFWGAFSNWIVNLGLSGPTVMDSFEGFLRVSVGYHLGILIVLLPCLLWMTRREPSFLTRRFRRDAVIAAIVVIALYLALHVYRDLAVGIRQGLLMLMITPAVALTLLHGWRGAAFGTWVGNLAVGAILPNFGFEGAHDSGVFIAQQALVIAATAMLTIGWAMTRQHQDASRSGVAEREAKHLARTSFATTEHMLREQLLYMAQMQLMLDGERKMLADWLRSQGRFEDAMNLNSSGVVHRQAFDEQAMALYPIQLEEGGLFKAVHNQAFSDFWAGDAPVSYGFRGPVKALSTDLQLTAYRCICHAMALLSDYNPDEYRINMRAWSGRRWRGIVLHVEAVPTTQQETSHAGETAHMLLDARIKAHGGLLRRHGHQLAVLLTEAAVDQ